MHTVLTLALLIAIAALVSALGDRMGRVAAKRKFAIFGLRPRLAASWIAVFTGVFIALGTVGLLSLLSSDARQMLFHFEELKASVNSLQKEVDTLEYSRKTLAADKSKLEGTLETARTELGVKEKEAQSLSSAIETSNQRRAQVMQELAKTNTTLKASKSRLEEVTRLLQTQKGNNDKLKAEQAELQVQVDTLTDTKSSLITEAADLEQRVADLGQRVDALRQGNLALQVNQPLRYIPVSAALSLPESQKVIVGGLNELRNELEARGLQFQPVTAEAMTNLMNTLSLLTEDALVIVYSAKNVLPGETAEVTFELALNKLIFRKGEVITRINIDADVTREKLPELFGNAFGAIRATALSRGMLPDISSGEIGAISSSDIARAADQVEAIQGKRVMEIRAGKDFHTTDTLDSFEFVVKKA
jgi:uncharacterized protein (DUF3084 family)